MSLWALARAIVVVVLVVIGIWLSVLVAGVLGVLVFVLGLLVIGIWEGITG